MLMNVMLKKDEIKGIKKMLFTGYDQFEKFLKNPDDPLMISLFLETIKDQKEFLNSFLDDVEMINISMEKKIDLEEKK